MSAKTSKVLRLTDAEAAEGRVTPTGLVLPEITVFEHRDFEGDSWRTSFAYSYVGDDWNDKISSFIIHAGSYQFYEHADFIAPTGSRIYPGHYPWVGDLGICNDCISSWHCWYG